MKVIIYEIARIIGLITGYPAQLLLFKRRTYYEYGEDGRRTNLFKGGKLIISNHFSMLDYVLTSFVVFPRKLNAVSGEDPYKIPFFRWGMKFFGTIKADRITRSMRFMDECVKVIKDKGQLCQIFPEGHNTPDGKIHEFKHSYLVIAYRAGAPIVPIVTDGNYGLFKRASVIVGQEIDISGFFTPGLRTPPRAELEVANQYVFNKVLALRQELEDRKNKKKRKNKK